MIQHLRRTEASKPQPAICRGCWNTLGGPMGNSDSKALYPSGFGRFFGLTSLPAEISSGLHREFRRDWAASCAADSIQTKRPRLRLESWDASLSSPPKDRSNTL